MLTCGALADSIHRKQANYTLHLSFTTESSIIPLLFLPYHAASNPTRSTFFPSCNNPNLFCMCGNLFVWYSRKEQVSHFNINSWISTRSFWCNTESAILQLEGDGELTHVPAPLLAALPISGDLTFPKKHMTLIYPCKYSTSSGIWRQAGNRLVRRYVR